MREKDSIRTKYPDWFGTAQRFKCFLKNKINITVPGEDIDLEWEDLSDSKSVNFYKKIGYIFILECSCFWYCL